MTPYKTLDPSDMALRLGNGPAPHHQQPTHKRKDPAMTSTPHLIDHWFWLPRCMSWQGLYLTELQKQLTRVPRLNSGEINLTISADL